MMTDHSDPTGSPTRDTAPAAVHESDADAALPRLRPLTWVLIVAGIAAMVGVAAWVGFGQASQPVRWQDVGFEVATPTEATITYEVYLYTDEVATCHVRALNERFAEVGVGVDSIDPADGDVQRITTTMATTELATTVVVRYCDVE